MLRSQIGSVRMVKSAPATATSAGSLGDCYVDGSNGWVYFCYAMNLWARAGIAAW